MRAIAALLLAPLVVIIVTFAADTQRVDMLLYDFQLPWWKSPAPEDIVIVAVDDYSIDQLGRWPFNRRDHALLLETLSEYQARFVIYDVLFVEPATDEGGDAALANALHSTGNVILAMTRGSDERRGGAFELLPLPELAEASAAIGHSNITIDEDGLIRRVHLEEGEGRSRWPSLAAVTAYLDHAFELTDDSKELNSEINKPLAGNWVRKKAILVPFIGPPGSFPTLPFVDVMEGRVDAEALRDRYVLVGVTASGLAPRYGIPVAGNRGAMSGVEIQANALDAILRNRAIRTMHTHANVAFNGSLAMLAGLLILAPLPILLILRLVLAVVLIIGTWLVMLWHFKLLLPIVPALLGLLSVYIYQVWRQYRQYAIGAGRDGLTQLYNRGRFDQILGVEFARAKSDHSDLSLLLIDVDHFKNYNDYYGHPMGDQALRTLSRLLHRKAKTCRGIAARYGGEELVMVLPNTSSDDAIHIAGDICSEIKALGITHERSTTADSLTVSIGVATMDEERDSSPSDLIEMTDRALYDAKANGRNCIRSYNSAIRPRTEQAE